MDIKVITVPGKSLRKRRIRAYKKPKQSVVVVFPIACVWISIWMTLHKIQLGIPLILVSTLSGALVLYFYPEQTTFSERNFAWVKIKKQVQSSAMSGPNRISSKGYIKLPTGLEETGRIKTEQKESPKRKIKNTPKHLQAPDYYAYFRKISKLLLVTSCLCLLASANAWHHLSVREKDPVLLTDRAQIQAKLTSDPKYLPGRNILLARVNILLVNELTSTQKAILYLKPQDSEKLNKGDTVKLFGKVKQLSGTRIEAVSIWAQSCKIIDESDSLETMFSRFRSNMREATQNLPLHAKAIIPGITVGDDSEMTSVIRQDMADSSILHLTAVSGSHAVIIIGIFGALSSLIGANKIRRAFFALIGIVFLLLIVPNQPSVARSVLMSASILLSQVMKKPINSGLIIAITVYALFLYDPYLSLSLGFGLSVCATGALIWFSPALERWIKPIFSPLPFPISLKMLTIPIAAQVGCIPILILFSPQMPTYGILANILAAPVIAPITVIGITSLVFYDLWRPISLLLINISSIGTWWLQAVATTISNFPFSTIPWIGGGAGVLLYGLISLVVFLLAPQIQSFIIRMRKPLFILSISLVFLAGVKIVEILVIVKS